MGATPNVSLSEWKNTIRTNLISAFLGAKYQLPTMLDRSGGSLIFTSTFVGTPYQSGLLFLFLATASFNKAVNLAGITGAKLGNMQSMRGRRRGMNSIHHNEAFQPTSPLTRCRSWAWATLKISARLSHHSMKALPSKPETPRPRCIPGARRLGFAVATPTYVLSPLSSLKNLAGRLATCRELLTI